MEKWFTISWESLFAIILSGIGIYAAVILFTRISGKRSFSKMSSFDFAMTVAIGSIIASTLLSKSITLPEGVVGLGSIYGLQLLIAFLRRFHIVTKIVDNSPLLLMDGPNILEDNLKSAGVTHGDLRSKLREANVLNFSQIKAVVFETTGDISVLHTEDDKNVEDWLLKDVKR